jgi:hypothetical protein
VFVKLSAHSMTKFVDEKKGYETIYFWLEKIIMAAVS